MADPPRDGLSPYRSLSTLERLRGTARCSCWSVSVHRRPTQAPAYAQAARALCAYSSDALTLTAHRRRVVSPGRRPSPVSCEQSQGNRENEGSGQIPPLSPTSSSSGSVTSRAIFGSSPIRYSCRRPNSRLCTTERTDLLFIVFQPLPLAHWASIPFSYASLVALLPLRWLRRRGLTMLTSHARYLQLV